MIQREKVMLGKIYGFLSEKTGDVVTKPHPCIFIDDKNGNRYSFIFSHDKDYGVKDKELRYSILSPEQKFSNTRVLEEDLKITRDYYYVMSKDKTLPYKARMDAKEIYENVSIGYICYHPIAKERAYLEQEVPKFDISSCNRDNFKTKTSYKEDSKTDMDLKNFFTEGMRKVEKALLNDRLFVYKSSLKDSDSLFETQKEPFSLKDRIDFAFALDKEIKIQNLKNDNEKTKKMVEINLSPKANFIEFLIKNDFAKDNKKEINEILRLTKLEDYDRKLAFCENEISFRENKLAQIENYCGLGSIEKTKRYKEELITLKSDREETTKNIQNYINKNYDLLEKIEPNSEFLKELMDDEKDNVDGFNDSCE